MEAAFLKLKQHPPFEIIDAFKSSYDTLSDSEKNIFLDIACFFQGENVDYVMQLLDGCGFFPHVGIDVLVDKCLVTVSENRVWMHNLTQDAGRKFILVETVQIERRSRLWEPQNIKYLLEECEHEVIGEAKTSFKRAQGTEAIEGMFLDTSYLNLDIKPGAFVNMLNLRLLKIYCSNPEIRPVIKISKGFLHSLPNELRLLHWENYPLESLPQNFDPRHLVEINMPYGQLQKLWGGTNNLEKLRTVRLCNSQQLIDIDDILKAQNIEVIDLQGCPRLQSFPATGQLIHLRVVNLSGCTEIKSLQAVPPNIDTLNLQGTGIMELSLSIVKPNGGELLSLVAEIDGLSDALKLERLESLKQSSSSCQHPCKLKCLELKDCFRLQSLPNLVNLELLTVLDLSGCSKLESIQGFPRNLKELHLTGTAVRKVPQLPPSLELLNAHGCLSLKKVPLDSEKLSIHYTFPNCFNLSPQVVSDFLVKLLGNVKHIPRELPLLISYLAYFALLKHELNEAPAFSFCAPSYANQNSTLDLQLGFSSFMWEDPSWRNTVVGFTMLVEVTFSEDHEHDDANGFRISCICRWKNKEGHSHRIKRTLHCWAEGKVAPKVRKDHMFVFSDVKMRLGTDICVDLVVFEFFPVNQQTKRLDDSCTVKRCGRQMALQFINCFKLNHQAREFILRSDCAYRDDRNFLTVSLPRITLSRKILSFKACMVVKSRVCCFDFGVNWFSRGARDTKYFSLSTNIYSKTNHLIVFGFECSSEGFSDHVQFNFFCHDQKKETIKIKECGLQLLEVSPSLNDGRKHFETEDDDKSGVTDAESSRSSKQMRVSMNKR
ncbi:unnamed protein product [Brassica oleracea var. botrytis]